MKIKSHQDQSRSDFIQPRSIDSRRILGSATSDGVPESVSYTKRRELLDAIDLYNLNKKESFAAEESVTDKKKPKGFLGAETKGAQKIEMNDEGKKIIELIEELALYNPTEVPLRGFLGYKEVCIKHSTRFQLFSLIRFDFSFRSSFHLELSVLLI